MDFIWERGRIDVAYCDHSISSNFNAILLKCPSFPSQIFESIPSLPPFPKFLLKFLLGNCCGRHNNFICLWKFMRANRTTRAKTLTPACRRRRRNASKNHPSHPNDHLRSPSPSKNVIHSSPQLECHLSLECSKARCKNKSDCRNFGGKR